MLSVICAAVLFQAASSKCGDIFLTNLKPAQVDDLQYFTINEWVNPDTGAKVTSMLMGNGKTYSRFLFTHPSSYASKGTVTYNNLGENYDSFTAVVGLAGVSPCITDGVRFKFYVDNILKHTSQLLKTKKTVENININTKNGNVLKIEIEKNTDHECDNAIIADPLLNYKTPTLPPPLTIEPGICYAAKWNSIGDLSDVNDIYSGNTAYNLYNYEFAVKYNALIHPVIINAWTKGLRVSTLNDYPMGDDSLSLKFGRTIFTYGLNGNPTANNWYQYYYEIDNDKMTWTNGNGKDCVELYARKIHPWTDVGTLATIKDFAGIEGYPQNEYEYGVKDNSLIHKVIINSWNKGIRVSTMDSYPQGDTSQSLKFGKAIFTRGLKNNPTTGDWYHRYYYVNGNEAQSSNGIANSIKVFVKQRESLCV